MQKRNIDGIKTQIGKTEPQKLKPKRKVLVDAVKVVAKTRTKRPAVSPTGLFYNTWKIRGKNSIPFLKKEIFSFRRLPVFATVCLIVFGFLGGMYFTLRTDKSTAEGVASSISETQQQPSSIAINQPSAPLGPIATVPNEVLFSLSLDQLEAYLAEATKTPEMKEAEKLAVRKEKLTEYLKEKGSPFVNLVDTIAELKHWKLVLAVSNAESTMGKHCYNNNCSGIGVEPGHPLWREYSSTREWAMDLDKLLEKRYKDWTLDQMNGVYNKPGSSNWLSATKQVLEELQEKGIE